jgi:HAD superfamily hydrolase (TIGR01459 family)
MNQNKSAENIEIIGQLSDLSGRYKAILCDIWGVLHNGRDPFPDAVRALQDFRAQGGIVVMVSNSPRPSETIPAQFKEIGVPDDVYDGIVTSGDATRDELENWRGKNVYHIGPERDLPLLEGMDLNRVSLEAADFVLCSGLFDDETETPDDYAGDLKEMAGKGLTMICANPDIVVKRGETLIYCGGAIAQSYEALGGPVVYGGKPHRPIYELARARIEAIAGRQLPLTDLLMVGDGPKTDIFGAERYGIDSLFVAGGIHSEECFLASGELNTDGLDALFGSLGLWPHHAIPRLK